MDSLRIQDIKDKLSEKIYVKQLDGDYWYDTNTQEIVPDCSVYCIVEENGKLYIKNTENESPIYVYDGDINQYVEVYVIIDDKLNKVYIKNDDIKEEVDISELVVFFHDTYKPIKGNIILWGDKKIILNDGYICFVDVISNPIVYDSTNEENKTNFPKLKKDIVLPYVYEDDVIDNSYIQFLQEDLIDEWKVSDIEYWEINKKYEINDVLQYGNTYYKVVKQHISSLEFSNDFQLGYYEQLNNFKHWESEIKFSKFDIIKYNQKYYKVFKDFVANDTISVDINNGYIKELKNYKTYYDIVKPKYFPTFDIFYSYSRGNIDNSNIIEHENHLDYFYGKELLFNELEFSPHLNKTMDNQTVHFAKIESDWDKPKYEEPDGYVLTVVPMVEGKKNTDAKLTIDGLSRYKIFTKDEKTVHIKITHKFFETYEVDYTITKSEVLYVELADKSVILNVYTNPSNCLVYINSVLTNTMRLRLGSFVSLKVVPQDTRHYDEYSETFIITKNLDRNINLTEYVWIKVLVGDDVSFGNEIVDTYPEYVKLKCLITPSEDNLDYE